MDGSKEQREQRINTYYDDISIIGLVKGLLQGCEERSRKVVGMVVTNLQGWGAYKGLWQMDKVVGGRRVGRGGVEWWWVGVV